jgi:hypothetical protein
VLDSEKFFSNQVDSVDYLAIIYLPNQSQRMTRQRWRVFILGIQQSRQQEGSRHDGQRFQMIPSNVAGRSGQRILDAFFLSSFA